MNYDVTLRLLAYESLRLVQNPGADSKIRPKMMSTQATAA